MIPDETLDLPAIELSSLLAAKQFTATDLAKAYLARIERLQPRLNCFVTVTPERALDDAARADRELALGRHQPLTGLPYVLKDAIDTAGIRTTWGTKSLLDRIPTTDAIVVRNLRDAGCVLLGKASLTELCNAFGNKHPEDNHNGACRNPWDPTRWSGGSSGGSSSAVAAGLCAFAIGTETWGSIDHPAGYCGIVGLRPTYDLIPRAGSMTSSWSLDKIGILCRDARDARMVLPFLTNVPAEPIVDGKTLRIGIADAMAEPVLDPANVTTWDAAKTILRTGTTEMIELPDLPSRDVALIFVKTDALVALDELVRSNAPLYDRETVADKVADHRADNYTAGDYVRAMRVRTLIQEAYRELFERFDVIVSFGNPIVPQRIGEPPVEPKQHGARMKQSAHGNLAGLPAITIPIGFTAAGIPRSMQFIAAPYEEHKLFAIAELFQSQTDFHKRRPKL